MSLKKRFGTSKEAIEKGAWIDIVENEDETMCRIRILRMNQQNPAFVRHMANHRKAFSSEVFSATKLSQAEASMIEVLVDTVITDWENVVDWRETEASFPSPDKYLEFTKDNVRAMLIDFPDLTELLIKEADNIANFQETEAKNS